MDKRREGKGQDEGNAPDPAFLPDIQEIDPSEALIVDVDGYEGPLDLLLALARTQKVDISKISILSLAEQYLAFINDTKNKHLRLAADYLVMAAWLAYLKSRLLLPEQSDEDELTGEELAAHLAFRLQRLEAMRDAAARLMARDRLGRDIFARGAPEPIDINTSNTYLDTLYDLLKAYAQERQRSTVHSIRIRRRPVVSIKAARRRLERLLGTNADWIILSAHLTEFMDQEEMWRTSLASSFTAALELVREGGAQVRQTDAFSPLYVKGTGHHEQR